jgi:hydrogenase expression/formation protein HypE
VKKEKKTNISEGLLCPVPISGYKTVLLAHGGGGRLMHDLIEKMIVPEFSSDQLGNMHDGAVLDINGVKIAFTTDSYVIDPLFFPGGNIGDLAVYGTVNDLAMCGAKPLFLSTGFVIEEGLPMETLYKIVLSMKEAGEKANVKIVTGDTKVVDKGKGDGIFINTSGVGLLEHDIDISPVSIKTGDLIILNGDIGRHGIAVMSTRQGFEFENSIESDCAPLNDIVKSLLDSGIRINCLRDLTRGGLACALNEIAETKSIEIHIKEKKILVREDVQSACEILGFDPLYVANEGRFIAFVNSVDAEKALDIMKKNKNGEGSMIIGEVKETRDYGLVTMESKIGANRIVDMLSGEQLPRIC